MGRARVLLAVLVVPGLVGCDSGDEAEARGADRAHAKATPQESEVPSQKPSAEVRSGRVRYDLASHLTRAQLRHAGNLVIDFGVAGAAKYTLGGWQTGIGDNHELRGARVTVIPGETGRVFVPARDDSAATLTVRAGTFHDGPVTFYVNGDAVATESLPSEGLGTVRIPIEQGRLERGDNLLQLRVRSRGPAPGIGRAGLALDWLRLDRGGPEDAAAEPAAPPPPDVLGGTSDGEPTLTVPAGWSLGYAFEAIEGDRLRGRAEGPRGVLLKITAHGDGGKTRSLATIEARPKGAPFDVQLGALAGRVARIDLTAEGGEVRLRRPVVVSPRKQAAMRPVKPPKNVLVYLVDTLRADKLRAYNPGTRVRTPGFTQLAQKAALFESAHAPANWTKPSVATLLSALMPWEHHATGGEAVLPRSVRTLPERLGNEGFVTAGFVANGYVSSKFGFDQGWDHFRNYIREGKRTHARFVAEDVASWLDERPEDRPFFLYVQTIDPHVPYIPPEELLQEYDPKPYHGPVDFRRDRQLLEKVKSGQLTLDDRDKARLEALHDGEITYHDEHFAAVMDALDERGLAEETVVVFTSDHGEEFFDHGSVGHGHSVWQELLHVPLAIRIPGLTDHGMRLSPPAGLVDVMPTVLDALGLARSAELQGRSLLPRIRGRPPRAPRVVVSGFHDGWRTAVAGDLKLIQRTWEHPSVYDLEQDPGETNDRAASRSVTLRYLRGLLGLALAGDRSHEAVRTRLDGETREQLRALGYVGASAK